MFRDEVKVLETDTVWYTDQLIITWSLLASRICSVPASSGLWNLPGLTWSHQDKYLDSPLTREGIIEFFSGRNWTSPVSNTPQAKKKAINAPVREG